MANVACCTHAPVFFSFFLYISFFVLSEVPSVDLLRNGTRRIVLSCFFFSLLFFFFSFFVPSADLLRNGTRRFFFGRRAYEAISEVGSGCGDGML